MRQKKPCGPPILNSFFIPVFCLALVFATCHGHAQGSENGSESLKRIEEEFQKVHNQIHEVQKEATKTKAVQKAQEEFTRVMDEAMLKLSPDDKETLQRSKELLEKIRAHPNVDDPRVREQDLELKKMLLDYKFLERKLTPARREAAQEPQCQEKFEKLEEVLLKEMKKINPDIDQLMDHKEKLAAEYREIRQVAD